MKFICRGALVIVLSVILLLTSCSEEELGNNYYYMPDYEVEDVGYPYGAIVYKSEEKSSIADVKIIADVLKVNHNKKYIIALQNPNKKILAKSLKSDFLFWEDYYLKHNRRDSIVKISSFGSIFLSKISQFTENKDSSSLNSVVDSIIKNTPFYNKLFKENRNYYIIDKIKDSTFGPLSNKEFENIKLERKLSLDF